MNLPTYRLLQLKKKTQKEKNQKMTMNLLGHYRLLQPKKKPTQEKQAQDNDEPLGSSSFFATQETKLKDDNELKDLSLSSTT
jgi:hypothetical protein